MADLELTCIEFSEETKQRAEALTNKSPECWLLLAEDVRGVAIAISKSGRFLRINQSLAKVIGDDPAPMQNEALAIERENQSTLAAAGITDDTTADQWLTPIEEKLSVARSEYQKLSDRHQREIEELCKQWMVTL